MSHSVKLKIVSLAKDITTIFLAILQGHHGTYSKTMLALYLSYLRHATLLQTLRSLLLDLQNCLLASDAV